MLELKRVWCYDTWYNLYVMSGRPLNNNYKEGKSHCTATISLQAEIEIIVDFYTNILDVNFLSLPYFNIIWGPDSLS